MRRPTMRDVAQLAGVGKVTVSYVLNGQSRDARISDETARKVLKAANDLNYRPNAVARMLVTKRTDLIAVVFQRGYFFTSWSAFTADVMRGVSTAAVETGFDLMLHTKDVALESEADVLADGRVDGALVLRDGGDPVVAGLEERGLPCVRFFSRSQTPHRPYVDADNYSGGRLATQHLVQLGHTRVGMVRGAERSTSSSDRFNGYRDALERAGMSVRPEYLATMSSAFDDMHAVREMMRRPDRPTALFVWSDDVAFSLMPMLRDMGLRIPEDVSLVGFDSLDACERSMPPLTSVRQPVFEMAVEATRMLVTLIRGESLERAQVLYPLMLDIRGSTGPSSNTNPQ